MFASRDSETEDQPAGEVQATYRSAGAIRRLLATLIDMTVYCAVCAAIALPVIRTVTWCALPNDLEQFVDVVSDPAWISHASGVLGMWIALWWAYFAVGWGLFGATPGKRLLGIKIIDYQQRSPIGLTRGVLRLVAYTVSSLTFCVGHLMLLFRSDRCALHDLLAGTRVVRR